MVHLEVGEACFFKDMLNPKMYILENLQKKKVRRKQHVMLFISLYQTVGNTVKNKFSIFLHFIQISGN